MADKEPEATDVKLEENPDVLIVDIDDPDIPEPGITLTDTKVDPAEVEGEEEPTDKADPEPAPVDDPDKPVDDPLQKRFDELGLGSQYTNPTDVLDRVKDTNRYLDSLEKANLQQKTQLEAFKAAQTEKPKQTPEQLAERMETDPAGALADAGFVRAEHVQKLETQVTQMEQREQLRDIADTIGQYPELDSIASAYRLGRAPVQGTNKFWDEMNAEVAKIPGLAEAPIETILAVTHPRVKARLDSQPKPTVTKLSDKDKAEATTTGSPSRKVSPDQPDYSNMEHEEIFADYQKRGQVGT